MDKEKPSAVSLVLVGCGARGATYAAVARQFPDELEVVAICDLRPEYRAGLAVLHTVPETRQFSDWRELLSQPRLAAAAVISLPDALHVEVAVALAAKGYHLLLEKPMATDPDGCQRIAEAVRQHGVLLSVCHVMRYSKYTRMLKRVLAEGRIGDLVSVQHLEPVGVLRQTHAFVRGNWRNSRESTFMLMSKSCHDIDWICHLMGNRCRQVSSFGGLFHFRAENRPVGAANRCLGCGIESSCPYSALRLYLGLLQKGGEEGLLRILTPEVSEAGILEALRSGPYGRCVYACDNDVVDHQVVIMEFDGGATASFTMTGFTPTCDRLTHIGGTAGYIYGNGQQFSIHDYATGREQLCLPEEMDEAPGDRHGGGDIGVIRALAAAIRTGDAGLILSGAEETLASHRLVFAAERARIEGRVIGLDETGQR